MKKLTKTSKNNINLNLLKFLSKEYGKHGWNCYSDIINPDSNPPGGWKEPRPDIIIVKKAEIVAVCIESKTSLNNRNNIRKWKDILKSNYTRLLIVVRDRETSELAHQIASLHQVEIETRIIKKRYIKKAKKSRSLFLRRFSKIDWIIIITGILIITVFFFILFSHILPYLKVSDYYQPFDVERQQFNKEQK